MRILIDESVPKKPGYLLPGHYVRTLQQVGWAGLKNGELLRRAKEEYDPFVTADQHIGYQQNLGALTLPVIIPVAADNRRESPIPLIPSLLVVLSYAEPGRIFRVGD